MNHITNILLNLLKSNRNWSDLNAAIISCNKSTSNKKNDVNDIFNVFVKYHLLNSAQSSNYKNVWLFDELPAEMKIKLLSWYKNNAKEYLIERTKQISDIVNIKFNQIKIGSANTRWGSCSTKNNINFTYKLLFLPTEIIDYVIVHELSHIIEHNHSGKFWLVVKKIMPDYQERQKQLKHFQKKITSYWY